MRFKIDWASLIVDGKFTVFALFYFVFEGHFPSTNPRGAHILRGDLTDGFLRHRFGGLIFGEAYTWRGLFSEFYGMFTKLSFVHSYRTRSVTNENYYVEQVRPVSNVVLSWLDCSSTATQH